MFSFVSTYLYWHYANGVTALLNHLQNLLAFVWRIFAVPTLLRTLLAPWHRLQERYDGGFNLSEAAATFTVNTLMRLVGLVVRLAMITLALISLALTALVGVAVTLLWLLLPLVWIGLLLLVIRIII